MSRSGPIPTACRFTQALCRKPPPSALGLNRRRRLFPSPGLRDKEREPDQPRYHRWTQEPRIISREAAIILLQAKRHEIANIDLDRADGVGAARGEGAVELRLVALVIALRVHAARQHDAFPGNDRPDRRDE